MKISTRDVVIALLALGWQAHAGAQEVRRPGAPPSSAPVQQLGYVDLLGGLAYTDNALLTGGHGSGDGIGTAGFNVDYRRLGELSLNLLGNLDRVEYLRGSFGGSFYGHFYGLGVLGKSTDVFQWQLRDTFGEGTTNPLSAPTPQNLQTINDVATGPLVNLHFGLTNRLTLFGLYSRTTYERSPYDSQTYQGGAQFRHAFSRASSLSLEAGTAHTKYINSTAVQSYFAGASTDYDIRQASISYHANFVRTSILLNGGYNTIQEGGGAKHGAPLYAVRISRKLSPFSTVFLSGRESYSTNGASMASPGAQISLQVGASLSPQFAVAQPFNQRSADLGWIFNRARTSLSLVGTYRKVLYDQTSVTNDYNHRDVGVIAILGRQLRPTVEVQLRAEGYFDRYSQLDAHTRRETVRLSFSKRLARTMIWFYAERRHQSGSPGSSTFQAASYNDDIVGLYVTYDLFGERPMQGSVPGMPGMSGFTGGY